MAALLWLGVTFVVSFHLALYGGYEDWWLPGGMQLSGQKNWKLRSPGFPSLWLHPFYFFHSIPLHSIPFHSIPVYSISFHSWWVLPFHIPFVIPRPLNVCLIPVRIKSKRWIQIHQKHREIKLKTMQSNFSISPLQTTLCKEDNMFIYFFQIVSDIVPYCSSTREWNGDLQRQRNIHCSLSCSQPEVS